MDFTLVFSEKFFDDVKRLNQSGQKKLIQKVEILVAECMNHPRKGTGHPEQLKFHSEETWSRRINKEHRLVYNIQIIKRKFIF